MIFCGLGVFVLIALCCPDTTIGRAVRRVLVDGPASALIGLTPRRALFLILALGFALAFAQIAPAEFLWIMAGDAATWLEIAALAWLLSASRLTTRILTETVAKLAIRLRPMMRSAGRMRERRAARKLHAGRRSPPKDEDQAPAWLAYA